MWHPLMLRRLLACLALLTGLTAAGAPAQAETASSLTAPIEASASGVTTVRSQATVAIARPSPGRIYAVASLVRPLAEQPGTAWAVVLRGDRARE